MIEGIFAQWHYDQDKVIGHSSDGVGSKLLFQICYGNLDDAAKDLAAMNLDDLSCEYITPTHFQDTIAMDKGYVGLKEGMVSSLRTLLKSYNVILEGGETELLPHQMKIESVIWNGCVYGTDDAKKHKFYVERRSSLEKGIVLCAIPDNKKGLGSNGFTAIHDMNLPFREEFTVPCRIYTPSMSLAREDAWFFAHITGGGYKNIERILPKNLDALVRLNHIPDVFKYLQDATGFSNKTMFETYNMGSRMVVGTKDPGSMIEIFGNAFIVGELREGNGKVFVNGIELDTYKI